MKLDKEKYKALHTLGEAGGKPPGRQFQKKVLGDLMDKVTVSLMAKKGNGILGCVRKNIDR